MILMNSSLESFMQLLGVLIIFAFVLAITYFTTKWLGGFQKAGMTGQRLQVIETVRIANNKYIQIVKAGEVYLIVAVGKDEVSLLAQLTEEQLAQSAEQVNDMIQPGAGGQLKDVQESFQETFNKIRERFPKKQD